MRFAARVVKYAANRHLQRFPGWMMRQFLGRLAVLLIVILVIFGVYRLITVRPLEPGAFFGSSDGRRLVVADAARLAEAPPYTLAAFQAAQQAGANALYLPLHLTRDGELVVLASPDLAVTTGRSSQVSDQTLAELQQLDAGYTFDPGGDGSFPWRGRGAQIMALPDVLAAFPEMRFVVSIEEPNLQSLAALLQAADATGSRPRLLALVDDPPLAATLRQQAPDIATANTTAETNAFLTTQRLRLTPFYRPAAPAVLLDGGEIRTSLVDAAHSRGIHVLALSSEGAAAALQPLIDDGIDGVVVQDLGAVPGLRWPDQAE